MAGDRLQDGIYWQSGVNPPGHLRLAFLNVKSDTSRGDTHAALSTVWPMLQDLRRGQVRDLAPLSPDDPAHAVPTGDLQVMIGYGARVFDGRSHPQGWTGTHRRPRSMGGRLRPGSGRPFPQLHWAKGGKASLAQTDIVLQFTATSELAVNRPIVELLKLIEDEDLPLELVWFQGGFAREDRRSWIDFHDGLNNMRADERAVAMEAVSQDDPWMIGGTYLAFLKIAVDLTVWRSLPRVEQEILVGRTKITGCPLTTAGVVDGQLTYETQPGCPLTGTLPSPMPLSFRNPPRPADDLVRASHIHRSNQNRGGPGQDSNNRIYRQGYEFLDWTPLGPVLGLNFLGFQRDMSAVRNILSIPSWMGAVNFGGQEHDDPDIRPVKLMMLLAGGFFAVPPKDTPYPGAALFH